MVEDHDRDIVETMVASAIDDPTALRFVFVAPVIAVPVILA